MNLDWVKNFKKPLLVIFYNDLVDNLEESLTKMLKFLAVSYTKVWKPFAFEQLSDFVSYIIDKIREVQFLMK